MKTPSDELFNLIKSLSGQEKRAFKLFPQQKSTPSMYVKLFNAIDSLEHYDEKKLVTILNKTGGIHHIKQVKSYLHESILRFLEYHYFDYSVEIQLQRQLQRIEILYVKQQFVSAKKWIAKAEKMAIENHHYLSLLSILQLKQKIITQEGDFVKEHQQYEKQLYYNDLYRNLLEYQKINIQTGSLLHSQHGGNREKAPDSWRKMLKNPFLKNEEKALSFPAKILYGRILGNIYVVLKNWEKSCYYYQRCMGYFEQAKLPLHSRLIVFVNLMIPLTILKKNEELVWLKNEATKLIQLIPKKAQTTSIYHPYMFLLNNYIDYQLSIVNIKEALSASNELSVLIEKNVSIESYLMYYSNQVLICLYTPDYRKALQSLHKILAKEKTGVRQDIISLTKILSLLVHYELDNEDTLLYLSKSYAAYFDKQSQQTKTEHILLNFFGKTIHATSAKQRKDSGRQERITLFIALKKELKSCKNETVFTQFDFISWAESKIQNRPMIDILKEKSLKKVGKL